MSSNKKDHSARLLSKLNNQLEKLFSHTDNAPKIEIDIIKENLRHLYDLIDSYNTTTMDAPIVTNQHIEDIDNEINNLLDIADSEFAIEDQKIEKQIAEQEIVLEEQYKDDKHEPEIPQEKEITKLHDELTERVESEASKEVQRAKEKEIALQKEIEKKVEIQLAKEKAEQQKEIDKQVALLLAKEKEDLIKQQNIARQKAIEEKVALQLAEENEGKIQKDKEEKAHQKAIEEKVAAQLAKEKADEARKAKEEKEQQEAIEEKVALQLAKDKKLQSINDQQEESKVDTDIKKTVHVLDVLPDDDFEETESNSAPLLPSKIKLKPIKSLKNGIGINDKFMIINDLFEGRAKDFNKALTKLDSLKDTQAALFLLGDMKDENLWETQDNVFKTFKMYVERRYTK